MADTIQERKVARVVDTYIQPGGTSDHTVRLVLEPGRWQEHDPFLLMAEDWFTPGTFDDHPHRGIETVTYIIEGELAHRDNHGGAGLLAEGDVQWMTAGRGIIHNENPIERAHSLQLWVNLPSAKKMTPPRYQDLKAAEVAVRREPGAEMRVFSGTSGGVQATTLNHVPVTMVDLRLTAGASVRQELPASYNAFFYILSGSVALGVEQTAAKASQVAWLDLSGKKGESSILIEAKEDSHLILWAGEPVREPVVARGPFVMNSMEEIRQAYEDFYEGKF